METKSLDPAPGLAVAMLLLCMLPGAARASDVPFRPRAREWTVQRILKEAHSIDAISRLEANWWLVGRDPVAAYDAIRAESLRRQALAQEPQRPGETLLERSVLNAKLAAELYRLLQRIDPVRYATAESQAELASVRHTRANYVAALEVVNYLRRTAASDWMDGVEEEDEASGSGDEGPGLWERLRDLVLGWFSHGDEPASLARE